ncbi:hypothetical protein QGM71_17540 [Virgibacillus sp. C22-A2]|uniref:Uncharacterized protein n=1 Tax=Virgibacillus tibetensis TaxID=3042313 RepID=A0ABU6KK96_9BACI|nr:hypothetical protein [Virgibacillus sp. C22-A2]
MAALQELDDTMEEDYNKTIVVMTTDLERLIWQYFSLNDSKEYYLSPIAR